MRMPALANRRWTADEVRALPEKPGTIYEVIDGELLVSPGPSFPHQRMMLDAITQQFVGDPAQLASWRAARRVVRKPGGRSAPPTPGESPSSPTDPAGS